jgi:hypothetical protein
VENVKIEKAIWLFLEFRNGWMSVSLAQSIDNAHEAEHSLFGQG